MYKTTTALTRHSRRSRSSGTTGHVRPESSVILSGIRKIRLSNFKPAVLVHNHAAADNKSRWQVELFFKWIKQHLRIKRFFGTSENAVKTQVWTAIAVYVLVVIIRKRLNLDLSLHSMLQILSVTPFEKEPLIQLLTDSAPSEDTIQNANQLNLF